MPKLDLFSAAQIKDAQGEVFELKGQGFHWVKKATLSDIVVTRASSATYLDENGLIKSAGVDEARDSHHIWKDGGWQKRLLIEPSATNLFTKSRDFSHSDWQNFLAGVVYDEIGIDGAQNTAATLEDQSSDIGSNVRQTFTVAADTSVYTMSLHFKKTVGATTFPGMRIRISGGTTVDAELHVDTDNGSATFDAAFSQGQEVNIQDQGDWWRVSFEVQNNGTVGNETLEAMIFPAIATTPGVRDTSLLGSAVVDGAQLEKGYDNVTSFIFTDSAQVTRAGDVALFPSGVWPFSTSGFSVVLKGEMNYVDYGSRVAFYSLGSHYVAINLSSTGLGAYQGRLQGAQLSPNPNLVSMIGRNGRYPASGVLVPFHIGVRHAPFDYAVVGEGIIVGNHPTSNVPPLGGSSFRLGQGAVLALEEYTIYGKAMSNAALIGETS